MGFSTAVKDELARLQPGRDCCPGAELAGMIAAAGHLSTGAGGDLAVTVSSGHATVARRAYGLLRAVLGRRPAIRAAKRPNLDKATYFVVTAEGPEVGAALARAGITDPAGEPLDQTGRPACCRLALLRGAFLGAGFLADPRRNYHWELTATDRRHARSLRRLLAGLGLRPGLARRRQEYVVYLKDAEGIAAWLNLAGAHQALLSLENARIYKDLKNRVNRLVNCETANLGRTVNAGLRQQAAIRRIDEAMGLGALPEGLRQVAELRLANPGATLEEIGMSLPRRMSKSGVNHRLRQLVRIAGELESGPSGSSGGPAGASGPVRR